jgi:HSP20 family protein
MDYIKIKFGNDFDCLAADLEDSISGMFRPQANAMFRACEYSWNPCMDIYETSQEVIIRAELAGVEKDDLGIEISAKAVKIYGQRKEMTRENRGAYRLAEIQYGRFERVLFLPAPIDPEVASSSYANGFLQIRLAKLPTDITHKIPITDG